MEVQQQGEVRIERISDIPEGLTAYTQKNERGDFIISHSENGHHHVIPEDGVTVLERPLGPEYGQGMSILYAIVAKPTEMRQDATGPHKPAIFEPGMYALIRSIEVDPFTKQARIVAD